MKPIISANCPKCNQLTKVNNEHKSYIVCMNLICKLYGKKEEVKNMKKAKACTHSKKSLKDISGTKINKWTQIFGFKVVCQNCKKDL